MLQSTVKWNLLILVANNLKSFDINSYYKQLLMHLHVLRNVLHKLRAQVKNEKISSDN
jgi:hypothetical protein